MDKKQMALADQMLVKLIKDEPIKMLQFMLTTYGKEMLAANAETMKVSQESTLSGKRYKIECNAKITEVK